MLFPQDMLTCVVFIDQRTPPGGEHWGGTGFFVSLRVPQDPMVAHVPFVTADHYVRGRTKLIMRVNGPKGAEVIVSATASSGLTVTFTTTTPAVCTSGGTNGATITLLETGKCIVQANQAGNATYSSARAVSRSFTVRGG